MTRVGGPKPPAVGGAEGRNVIRPMYGIFIRDNLAKFRTLIQTTIEDTKAGLKAGDPKAKAVAGDGVLQGHEYKKAKAALKDLQRALRALKPVFTNLGAAPAVSSGEVKKALGRPVGGPIAMYGVIFRDDLRQYRNSIGGVIAQINEGMATLKPQEKAEAKKAITALKAALKDLSVAGQTWN